MRLIHAPTQQMERFDGDIPDYVILSHTWGSGEITFDDFGQAHAQQMEGYTKLRRCCEQALQDGFDYVWIDSACIDKRSSAELSEAINSMYKWYWRASICYAYLSDVPGGIPRQDKDQLLASLRQSRWFARGWTLQELLAPAVVEFYDSDWNIIGTKASLVELISSITRIHESALRSRANIKLISVAQKLSWAATRETSREEDMAYCLLGLLGVNMPLLYGEGKRAFYRLQLELLKASNDHTIFGWEFTPGVLSQGFLADSPLGYINSANVRPVSTEARGFTITNRGLQISLPCIQDPDRPNRAIALLNCYFESSTDSRHGRVGIVLDTYGTERHYRVSAQPMLAIDHIEISKAVWKDLCIVADPGMVHYEVANRRSPYVVSLMAMQSFDTRFAPTRLAKYALALQNGQLSGMKDPISLEPSPLFLFEPDDFAGILFRDGARSFMVAFGQRAYSMIWLVLQPGLRDHQFEPALKAARIETINDADLYRDAVDAELDDGTVISIRAKKMRRDGVVGWQIMIDTAVRSAGVDISMVDEPEQSGVDTVGNAGVDVLVGAAMHGNRDSGSEQSE